MTSNSSLSDMMPSSARSMFPPSRVSLSPSSLAAADQVIVKAELFEWLSSSKVLREQQVEQTDEKGNRILKASATSYVLGGFLTADLLNALNLPGAAGPQKQPLQPPIVLTEVTDHHSRIRNWSRIGEALGEQGIVVSPELLKMIVKGDSVLILSLLSDLHARTKQTSKGAKSVKNERLSSSSKERNKETPLLVPPPTASSRDLKSSATSRSNAASPTDTELLREIEAIEHESATETVWRECVKSMVKFGGLQPRLAQYILAPPQILAQQPQRPHSQQFGAGKPSSASLSLVYLKGPFEKLGAWLQDCYNMVPAFISAAKDWSSIHYLLTLFRDGMLSPDRNVAKLACKLISKLARKLHPAHVEHAWLWFSGEQQPMNSNDENEMEFAGGKGFWAKDAKLAGHCAGGAETLMICFNNHHSSLKGYIFAVIDAFCHDSYWFVFFSSTLKRLAPNPPQFMTFAHEVVGYLSEAQKLDESIVDVLLENALPYTTAVNTASEKLTGLGLLTEVWLCSPLEFGHRPQTCKHIITLLRKGCRSGVERTVQITSLSCLFSLLEFLTSDKALKLASTVECAPYVYKSLLFSLIENHNSEEIRRFILTNISGLLKHNTRLPVQVMVEPLVKQYSSSDFDSFDFDFFSVLVKHPRLPLRHAMLLMHLLGKVALNHSTHAKAACEPFLATAKRFRSHRLLVTYVEKYIKVALSLFMNGANRWGASTSISGDNALEVVFRILQLRDGNICAKAHTLMQGVCQDYREASKGKLHPKLEAILAFLDQEISSFDKPELLGDDEDDEDDDDDSDDDDSDDEKRSLVSSSSHVRVSGTKNNSSSTFQAMKDRSASSASSSSKPDVTAEMSVREFIDAAKQQRKTRRNNGNVMHKKHESVMERLRGKAQNSKNLFLEIKSKTKLSKAEQKLRSLQEERERKDRIERKMIKKKRERMFLKVVAMTTASRPEQVKRFSKTYPENVKRILEKGFHRPLKFIFKHFSGKHSAVKDVLFDNIENINNALSVADFCKMHRDLNVQPMLFSKDALLRLFREAERGGARPQMLGYHQFLRSIWMMCELLEDDKIHSMLPAPMYMESEKKERSVPAPSPLPAAPLNPSILSHISSPMDPPATTAEPVGSYDSNGDAGDGIYVVPLSLPSDIAASSRNTLDSDKNGPEGAKSEVLVRRMLGFIHARSLDLSIGAELYWADAEMSRTKPTNQLMRNNEIKLNVTPNQPQAKTDQDLIAWRRRKREEEEQKAQEELEKQLKEEETAVKKLEARRRELHQQIIAQRERKVTEESLKKRQEIQDILVREEAEKYKAEKRREKLSQQLEVKRLQKARREESEAANAVKLAERKAAKELEQEQKRQKEMETKKVEVEAYRKARQEEERRKHEQAEEIKHVEVAKKKRDIENFVKRKRQEELIAANSQAELSREYQAKIAITRQESGVSATHAKILLGDKSGKYLPSDYTPISSFDKLSGPPPGPPPGQPPVKNTVKKGNAATKKKERTLDESLDEDELMMG